MSAPDRDAYIAGLRQLADALERSEEIPLPWDGSSETETLNMALPASTESADSLVAVVRALQGTSWRQTTRAGSGTAYLDVTGRLAGLWVNVIADADRVCEPIEPQPVIERHCPALDAVIAETSQDGTP